MVFRRDVDDSSSWKWIHRIAFACICAGALLIMLSGNRVTPDAGAHLVQGHYSRTTAKPPKVFLLEGNKSLQGRALAVERNEDENFDEDEAFFLRELEKGYGSGPFPKSSSRSSKEKGKGTGSEGKKKHWRDTLRDTWQAKWHKKKQSKKVHKASESHNLRRLGTANGEVQAQSDDGEALTEDSEISKGVTVLQSRRLKFRDPKKKEHDKKPPILIPTAHTWAEELQSISSRFYIYDHPAILQSHIVDKHRRLGKAAFGGSAELDHVKTDTKGEQLILEALQHHPLKTLNPNEADIFIVPTPITELLSYGCQWENCTWYDDAFSSLSKHPIFKATQGHKHVIIALSWLSFNKRYSAFIPALSRNYQLLENVSVAHNYDPFGCLDTLRERPKNTSASDFTKVFQGELPVTNAFSLGLGFDDPFPIHLPTYKKFETSDYFLFYRSRVKGFAYGSTRYRNAPLDTNVIKSLPPSSIGHDVPYDEWVRGFTSSKYCLVIRGDTPHSHSLLYAVRAGCIPVIVSDDYSSYAPTFKSSMALEDFSIFIKEKDFLDNPSEQLKALHDLPEEYIRAKLDNLYVAQTMVIPNHPRSLFVPAFLKEAIEAEKKNVLPLKPRVLVHQGYVILSGWEYLYRVPSSLQQLSVSSTNTSDEPIVIVGVVSKSHNFHARHAIRGTWAQRDGINRVFFLVAGPWEDVEQEFFEHGDLLWLNMIEDDSLTTLQAQFLLYAVHAHAESYDYVFKTTDDTYVSLNNVETHLGRFHPDYWGACNQTMSIHHHPASYVLSRNFTTCASSYLVESSSSIGLELPSSNDNQDDDLVATEFLAEVCNVPCGNDHYNEFVEGSMRTTESMLYKHWHVMWKNGEWDA